MQTFKFLLHHDLGSSKLQVQARDIETARQMIMEAEGCPECAIEFYC